MATIVAYGLTDPAGQYKPVEAGDELAGSGSTDLFIRAATVATTGATDLTLSTNGAARWVITSAGHLLASSDNASDLGASGATRPRTAYIGKSLNVGPVAAPATTSGSFSIGDGTRLASYTGSTGQLLLTGATTPDTTYLQVTHAQNGFASTIVTNSGAGTAAAARFVVTNNASGSLSVACFSSGYTLSAPYQAGYGVIYADSNLSGGMRIAAVNPIQIATGATPTDRWSFTAAGHLLAVADNTYDIGASGATRPRDLWVGRVINSGSTTLAVATGDVAASDGTTNQYMFFDASQGRHEVRSQTDRAAFFRSDLGGGTDAAQFYVGADGTLTGGDAHPVISVVDGFASDNQGRGAWLTFNALSATPSSGYLQSAVGSWRENTGTGLANWVSSLAFATNHSTTGTTDMRLRWRVTSAGHFFAHLDNTYDIGASGATRPRTIYAGTGVNVNAVHQLTATTLGFFSTGPVTQQADIGALTDSSGGATDGTIAAVTGTGDDTNVNNNFAELTAKVNSLRSMLQAYGIMA